MKDYTTVKTLLGPEWTALLEAEFAEPYFEELMKFVDEEYKTREIFPAPNQVFDAYQLCKPNDVKVIIIGQDPYPNKNAHGLAFSSLETKTPVSLHYIFQEIADNVLPPVADFRKTYFPTNNLTAWAKQGVLLLNPVLTVRAGVSNSHADKGWEEFTTATIAALMANDQPMVVLVWGNYAKNAARRAMDKAQRLHYNCILYTGHPAAAAYGTNRFNGCKHFSQANDWLKDHNLTPIEWSLK